MSKELNVTVNRCPVFGCTIPRGIPHEHPAGVSAVMRDPVAPLNADERAELEQLRARVRNSELLTAPKLPGVYVIPEGAAMVPGRKLRDALLMAGHNVERLDMAREAALDAMQCDLGVVFAKAPEPRRTMAQSVGKFMAWMFGIPALLLAAFAIGHYFGWWV